MKCAPFVEEIEIHCLSTAARHRQNAPQGDQALSKHGCERDRDSSYGAVDIPKSKIVG